jgi:hypothetical protein
MFQRIFGLLSRVVREFVSAWRGSHNERSAVPTMWVLLLQVLLWAIDISCSRESRSLSAAQVIEACPQLLASVVWLHRLAARRPCSQHCGLWITLTADAAALVRATEEIVGTRGANKLSDFQLQDSQKYLPVLLAWEYIADQGYATPDLGNDQDLVGRVYLFASKDHKGTADRSTLGQRLAQINNGQETQPTLVTVLSICQSLGQNIQLLARGGHFDRFNSLCKCDVFVFVGSNVPAIHLDIFSWAAAAVAVHWTRALSLGMLFRISSSLFQLRNRSIL